MKRCVPLVVAVVLLCTTYVFAETEDSPTAVAERIISECLTNVKQQRTKEQKRKEYVKNGLEALRQARILLENQQPKLADDQMREFLRLYSQANQPVPGNVSEMEQEIAQLKKELQEVK